MTEDRAARRLRVMRESGDFETVLRFGLRLASRNFILRAHENSAGEPRLGIIAGRKAASRAVDRNRGKRLIREVFRAVSPNLGAQDVTIQLRNSLRNELNSAVRAELRELLDALAARCAVGLRGRGVARRPTPLNRQ